MYDEPGYGPGVDSDEPVRRKRTGSRRMRLRNTWQHIMSEEGMPFVQTAAPLKVFEKHIKELTERGVSDEDLIESWKRFALDARRGLIKRDRAPWFSYWGRRSRYIQLAPTEPEAVDWDAEDDEPPTNWDDE